MDYHRTFSQILCHIDANLKQPLTAESLARRAGFSTFHFCRMFSWYVGLPVMEYVRRRRLDHAAVALSGGGKILDIALEYGFETHSGFSKAFRRYFGTSPERYRLHAAPVLPGIPSIESKPHTNLGGIIMEPKYVTWPETAIAGYAIRTTSEDGKNSTEIPAFWAACMGDGRIKRIHGEAFVGNHAELGVCFPGDPETGVFDYIIGLRVKPGAPVPEGYHQAVLPAATYAVFSTPLSNRQTMVPNIQALWNYIFNEWFPASGQQYADGCADFEYYDERCASENACVVDIYIPIKAES